MANRNFFLSACVFGVSLSVSTVVHAQTPGWSGSYVADGQCYCAGTQHPSVAGIVVPTPVGGKSVAQVCSRIGNGPKLEQSASVFNFPVYVDPQCGNGPFSTAEFAEECIGTYQPGSGSCVGQGPKWNLIDAFSKPVIAAAAAEQPVNNTISSTDDAIAVARESETEIADTADQRAELTAERVQLPNTPRYIQPQRLKSETEVAKTEIAKAEIVKTEVAQVQPEAVPTPDRIFTNQADVAVDAQQAPRRIEKPLSRDEIRASQLVALEAARERARQALIDSGELIEEDAEAADELAESETDEPLTEEQQAQQQLSDAGDRANAEPSANKYAAEQVAQAQTGAAPQPPSTVSALRIPVTMRNSSQEFNYVEALPRSYAYGGNGVNVAASFASHDKFQYVLDASAAETYSELMGGVSYYLTPERANRMTVLVTAGVEYGSFEFSRGNVKADSTETGVFLGLSSRFVINPKFEVQAGLGYSSFFEGDLTATGAGFYHLSQQLDLTSKLEAGDNDSFGIGIRYYY